MPTPAQSTSPDDSSESAPSKTLLRITTIVEAEARVAEKLDKLGNIDFSKLSGQQLDQFWKVLGQLETTQQAIDDAKNTPSTTNEASAVSEADQASADVTEILSRLDALESAVGAFDEEYPTRSEVTDGFTAVSASTDQAMACADAAMARADAAYALAESGSSTDVSVSGGRTGIVVGLVTFVVMTVAAWLVYRHYNQQFPFLMGVAWGGAGGGLSGLIVSLIDGGRQRLVHVRNTRRHAESEQTGDHAEANDGVNA